MDLLLKSDILFRSYRECVGGNCTSDVLGKGSIFHTYKEGTGDDRISCNWLGKYTFGSVYIRGTRINLVSNVGGRTVLRWDMSSPYNEDVHDYAVYYESPDRVAENGPGGQENLYTHNLSNLDSDYTIVTPDSIKAFDSEYNVFDWQWHESPHSDGKEKELATQFMAGLYEGVVVTQDMWKGEFYFIHNYRAFRDELVRVNELARRAKVSFIYI